MALRKYLILRSPHSGRLEGRTAMTRVLTLPLRVRGAALEREHAARAPLDEEDDRRQYDNLAEDRPSDRFEDLVDDPQGQRADQRTEQIADPAEHDHEKAVDDIEGAEVRADIADLAQRHPGHPGNPGAETKGQRVDARG